MRAIRLSNGMAAYVSDEDFERVAAYNWHYHSKGYVVRNVTVGGKRTTELLHNFIMGKRLGFVVDHRDGNKLNNTRENLRWATKGQNTVNSAGHRDRKSRFKGVYWSERRQEWVADIRGEGQRLVSYHSDEVEAALAADEAALRLFGEFAQLNFPQSSRKAA